MSEFLDSGNKPFIEFGSTQAFFINDKYKIMNGVIQVCDSEGNYTIEYKVPGTKNQYEMIVCTYETIRFTLKDAIDYLIELLYKFIETNTSVKIYITDVETETGDVQLYFYESDSDILTTEPDGISLVEPVLETVSDYEALTFDYDRQPKIDKEYKAILKVDDKLYYTGLDNITIWNNDFQTVINFSDCIPVLSEETNEITDGE